MHWLKTFNTVAAGSLAILLTSCASIKAPKTLFITFDVGEENFKEESAQTRIILDKFFERFKKSNPDINLVYINYKSKNFYGQIAKDNTLNLGPDLVIVEQFSSDELIARSLTSALPKQQYFDSVYRPRIQADAKIDNEYTYAPFAISIQLACFNSTIVKKYPGSIAELEKLSASGKKIGLSTQPFDLIWTAGTQGAISEISSLGSQSVSGSTYPAIQKWLQWIDSAALYKNISFHKNSRDLGEKLKNNDLDWMACWGEQLEDLETTMGNNLGVSALPNGTTSKAFPTNRIYGFALGKNSSPIQREMAMKFIKANVNRIAQRKLQLDDTGLLAVNQNVSIPPESSKRLMAINTSFYEQRQNYSKEWPGIFRWLVPEAENSKKRGRRYAQLSRTLTDFTNGYIDIDEAVKIITNNQTN